MIRKFKDLVHDGRTADAMRLCEEACAEHKDDAAFFYELGLFLAEAATSAKTSGAPGPSNVPVTKLAKNSLQHALKLDPTHLQAKEARQYINDLP